MNNQIEPTQQYLKQAKWLTDSIFMDLTEVQKDALYFLMHNIDYHTENPQKKFIIDFDKFLKYKNTTRNNFYTLENTIEIINRLISVKGNFKNQYTGSTVGFNLIDNVVAHPKFPNLIEVTLAEYGVIFLYEKALREYVNKSKYMSPYSKDNNSGFAYTQIEHNVVNLTSLPQKRFFELLSHYKKKGFLHISLSELKMKLGFITFIATDEDDNLNNEFKQLELVFSNGSTKYKKVEKLKIFAEFKRNFLDGAIKNINKDPLLDISIIGYDKLKTGNKITHLKFKIKKISNSLNLSEEEQKCLDIFINFGLNAKQILFIMNRIGYENMYNMFNLTIRREKVSGFGIKYYDIKTGEQIIKIGGFLYEYVFHEILKKK